MVRATAKFAIGRALRSTYKHLILSVSLINRLRHRRNEDFKAAAEARHNSGQLAGRFYNLGLYEIGSQDNLSVSAINRATNQLNLITSLDGCIADQLF